MWNTIKDFAKEVGRRLGLIQHLQKIEHHKKINVDESEYKRINVNKKMYAGERQELVYKNTNRRTIRRKQMSLNMEKVIAEEMASLVFNEGVTIGLDDKSEKTHQWEKMEDTITSAKFKREFRRYLEYMFAMGGVVSEVYLDGDTAKLAFATADAVFPISQDSENVDEIVIANQFSKDGKVYTLLKWHEWIEGIYTITNELYESNNHDAIGDKVPLDRMFADMEEKTELDIERPTFVYIKPNIANNKHITSPLGLSIFDNSHDTLNMLDVMYDFWYNEFRMGKRRVAVPEYMVQTGMDINGNPFYYFDDSEELFVSLNGGEGDEFSVKDLTVELRTEQVIGSIQALLDILSMQVGFSTGTFTFDGGGIKTATQVVSEQSKTFRTRSSHLLVIEDALRDLIMSIYEVVTIDDSDKSDPLERSDISIDFNDGVFLDTDAQLKFYLQLHKEGGYPMHRVLMKVLGMSEEDAKETVQEAKDETNSKIIDTERAVANTQIEV